MECRQVMLDSSQAGFNASEPKTHFSLNFIQLAMHTPEHFVGQIFNIVGHSVSPVGHHREVYHEAVAT
jgi:hypothetical protein